MRHLKYYSRSLLGLLACLFLASCDPDGTCIDADDFGFPKMTVSAMGQNVIPDSTTATQANQVSEWTDSGLVLSGGWLNIVVRPPVGTDSTWTPWLNGITSPSTVCVFNDPVNPAHQITADRIATNTADIVNAPCWLQNGMLLYMLVQNPNNIIDPNGSEAEKRNPRNPTFHLGKTVLQLPQTQSFPCTSSGTSACTTATSLSPSVPQCPPLDTTSSNWVYNTFLQNNCQLPGTMQWSQSQLVTDLLPSTSGNPSNYIVHDSQSGLIGAINANETFGSTGASAVGLQVESGGWDGNPPPNANWPGGRLYFKINDNYYADNAGGYDIVFKGGAVDPNPGPIEQVIDGVKATFFGTQSSNMACASSTGLNCNAGFIVNGVTVGVAQYLFTNVVQNSTFIDAVRALITLYIIVEAILFMFGMIKMAHGELIIRLFKMAIILALISPGSWTFFYSHFFTLFVDGTQEVITLVTSTINGMSNGMGGSVSTTTGTGEQGLRFFDTVLHFFTSYETNSKIMAVMFGMTGANFFIGFAYGILIYFFIGMFIWILAEAAVGYLVCLMAVALLIIVAPLLICFMLFETTRAYFNNWLTQMASYCIQPIVLFAGLTIMLDLIMGQFYRTLGYRVCMYRPADWFFSLWHIDVRNNLFHIMQVPPLYNTAVLDTRYQDFPFLSPDYSVSNDGVTGDQIPSPGWKDIINNATHAAGADGYDDVTGQYRYQDVSKINAVLGGQYVEIRDVLVLGVLIYVMERFLMVVEPIARGLAAAGGSNAKVSVVAGVFGAPGASAFKNVIGLADKYGGRAINAVVGEGKYEKARSKIIRYATLAPLTELKEGMQDKIGGKVDVAMDSTVGKFLGGLSDAKLGFGIDDKIGRALGGSKEDIKAGREVTDKFQDGMHKIIEAKKKKLDDKFTNAKTLTGGMKADVMGRATGASATERAEMRDQAFENAMKEEYNIGKKGAGRNLLRRVTQAATLGIVDIGYEDRAGYNEAMKAHYDTDKAIKEGKEDIAPLLNIFKKAAKSVNKFAKDNTGSAWKQASRLFPDKLKKPLDLAETAEMKEIKASQQGVNEASKSLEAARSEVARATSEMLPAAQEKLLIAEAVVKIESQRSDALQHNYEVARELNEAIVVQDANMGAFEQRIKDARSVFDKAEKGQKTNKEKVAEALKKLEEARKLLAEKGGSIGERLHGKAQAAVNKAEVDYMKVERHSTIAQREALDARAKLQQAMADKEGLSHRVNNARNAYNALESVADINQAANEGIAKVKNAFEEIATEKEAAKEDVNRVQADVSFVRTDVQNAQRNVDDLLARREEMREAIEAANKANNKVEHDRIAKQYVESAGRLTDANERLDQAKINKEKGEKELSEYKQVYEAVTNIAKVKINAIADNKSEAQIEQEVAQARQKADQARDNAG